MASNTKVYTLFRLLVEEGPQAPCDRRGCVRCTSRRWRLLVYAGRGRLPGRAAAVSKCALREGRQRERSAQVIPRRSRFGSLLRVDRRPSSFCPSATNEPPAAVMQQVVKPPFT